MQNCRKHYNDSLYSRNTDHFLVVAACTICVGIAPSESELFKRGHFHLVVLDLALTHLGIFIIYFNSRKHSIFDYPDTSVIPVCICINKIFLFIANDDVLFLICRSFIKISWMLLLRYTLLSLNWGPHKIKKLFSKHSANVFLVHGLHGHKKYSKTNWHFFPTSPASGMWYVGCLTSLLKSEHWSFVWCR